MSANRQQPGAWPTNHAAQQSEIDNRLHVGDTVQVVRNAHRPAKHCRRSLDVHFRHLLHGRAVYTGTTLDRLPASVENIFSIRIESFGGLADKMLVEGISFQHNLGYAG